MDTTQIKPGIYKKMSFEDYLAIPAFHKSMVAAALRSTAHLHYYIETEKKSTKAMRFGSLFDCLLLEPEIFSTEFSQQPETYPATNGEDKKWNSNAKYCKEWNEEREFSNVTIYSKADYENALKMIGNIEKHTDAKELMDGGENQVVLVWIDKETGILCKARIDKLKKDILIDVKSTFNASKSEFKRTINNFMYHVQDAHYSEGWSVLNEGEVLPFGFVAVESLAPFCVATYYIGDESRLVGKSIFRRAINRYVDYLKNGPTGYSQSRQEIEIPQYAINQEDDEIEESLLGDTL